MEESYFEFTLSEARTNRNANPYFDLSPAPKNEKSIKKSNTNYVEDKVELPTVINSPIITPSKTYKKEDKSIQCRIFEDLYELLENKLEIYNRVKEKEVVENIKEKQKLKVELEEITFEKHQIIEQYEEKLADLDTNNQNTSALEKIDENVEICELNNELEAKLKDLSKENKHLKFKVDELNEHLNFYKKKSEDNNSLKKDLYKKNLEMQELEYNYKKLEKKLKLYETNNGENQSIRPSSVKSYEHLQQNDFNSYINNAINEKGEVQMFPDSRKNTIDKNDTEKF